MNTSPRTLWVWRRCLGPPTDEPAPGPADRESKRRYEELAHQWLELAEQRQRSA